MKKYIAIPLGCALILLGFILFFRSDKAEPNITACTMEALICPDGSAVGRTGSLCEFASCPNQNEFRGILTGDSENLVLSIAPPEGAGGLGFYNIPLSIRASRMVQDLVGEAVVVSGELITGNVLEVDAIYEADDGDAQVPIGITKIIGGLKVTLNEMVQDSRCPADAVCIEAGAVAVNATLKTDTEEITTNIASDEVPYEFAGFKISIVGVNPPRLSGEEPAPRSYVVKFKVQ